MCNTYDTQGRATAQIDQIGRTTTFDYTTVPGGVIITDPRGNQVRKTFSNGVLIAETKGYASPLAATWSFRYDPNTLGIAAVTGPDDRVTTMTYDASGNMLTRTDPLGRQASWTYDGFNNVLTATAPNPSTFGPASITTTNAYDAGGRLTSTSTPLHDAANPTTPVMVQTTYTRGDSAHPDDVTSVVDPDGKVSTFTYAAATGYQVTAADPLGNTTTSCYGTLGRVTETVPPKGGAFTCGTANTFKTTVTYNQHGQPLVTTPPAPDGATTNTYDPDDNLASATTQIDTVAANDQTTTYDYDPAGQLTTVTRPDGSDLVNEYWPDGQVMGRTSLPRTRNASLAAPGHPSETLVKDLPGRARQPLNCGLKERGSRRAKSDATQDLGLDHDHGIGISR